MRYLTLTCILITLVNCKTRGNKQSSEVASVETLDGQYEVVTLENDDEIAFFKKAFGEKPYEIPNEVKIGCGQKNCYLTIPRPKSGSEQDYKFGTTKISDGRAWYRTKNEPQSEEYAEKLWNLLMNYAPEKSENYLLEAGALTVTAKFVETEISCTLAADGNHCSIMADLKSNPRPN